MRLSRYSVGIVATEYERSVCFEDGLKDDLRVLIAPQRERDFVVLVEKAKIAEDVKRKCSGACFCCGSMEHRVKDCPQRAEPAQSKYVGASYVDAHRCELMNLTQGDRSVAEYETEFMRLSCYARGMVVSEYERCVRFEDSLKDSLRRAPGRGAGQTEAKQPVLVYAARCREYRDTPDSTTSEVTVLNPLGQSVRVIKLYRDVSLEMQGTIFLTNLMELSFGEFNLFLGIDWLVEHQVSLDCASKRVVLRTKGDVEVVMIGERRDYLSYVISALVAEKLVRIGTVRDFLDVFLEELLGLHPNREVEFGIEIFLGTTPMSIAPYGMARKEPESGKEFIVYSDTSHAGLGSVLIQDGSEALYF
ncbi:uncharacterized protein LOC128285477 [Gossypium arboreum]|uniref:uncharacterized protein LOC128285477 n=1 Tax=Gossypium arboreum TaxID=29729 RepID=UPI0022F15E4F|nr:uncharacterized protein LOC128285477 [Gossypium arboreum]